MLKWSDGSISKAKWADAAAFRGASQESQVFEYNRDGPGN
jgi:hypothetical protein